MAAIGAFEGHHGFAIGVEPQLVGLYGNQRGTPVFGMGDGTASAFGAEDAEGQRQGFIGGKCQDLVFAADGNADQDMAAVQGCPGGRRIAP